LRAVSILAVFLAAANAVALSFVHSYDLAIGPIHLVAHELFKPLLYLNAATLVAILASRQSSDSIPGWTPGFTLIAMITAALYAPSIFVNYLHHDWTHRHVSADITSLTALMHLFTRPQGDGFYRPLPFLSLWLDFRIFHQHYWGYHLQNIALHIANAGLILRLGARIGLQRVAAGFASLLFATAAVNFEPVMWPAARFDLMATLFTLLALLAALRYRSHPEVWHRSLLWMMAAFAAGALSKESAFCFPLLLVLLMAGDSLTLVRWTVVLGSAGLVAAIALGARIAVYGGLGGYPQAPHFVLHTSTITSFFTRALPAPLFAFNSSVPPDAWAIAAVAVFAIAVCGIALTCRGWLRRDAGLLGAAFLSAVPAANLVNWIGSSMQNTRYLYMSSIWIFLMLAAAAGNSPRGRRWLVAVVLANCLGAAHNVAAYQPIMTPERAASAPLSGCRFCPGP
jgi:hypothetical protein